MSRCTTKPTSAQTDQSLLCTQWVAKTQGSFMQTVMPRLISFRWMHRSFCYFFHAVAQIPEMLSVQGKFCLFVCVEVLQHCQQLRSCRAGQLPINTFPGQA